jgi:hypothetical protein
MLSPVSIISHTLSSLRTSPRWPVRQLRRTSRILRSTTSSDTESLASNLQCVPADDSCDMARARLGDEGDRIE